jgi:putative phage-type endonuclease
MSDDIELRREYVGGPGAAAILGVNPYMTPVALWMQLTGRAPPVEVNDAMRSGQRLERAVLDFAAEKIGRKVLPGPFLRDGILGGHLDGITEGELEVVEAKTVRTRRAWGEPGTGEVPPHVAAQCLHYLGLLAGAQVAWVPVLFSGLEFALYKVERDDAVIAQMREIVAQWWTSHIEADSPPAPVTGEDATRLFPTSAFGKAVIASDAVAAAVERLRAVRLGIAQGEEEKDALEGQIKVAMGDADTLLVNGEAAATWKSTKPALRFDSAAFKLAEPDQYRAYCREQSSRRFLLRG